MKKRLFGTILAAVLLVTQAMTVFAAGSKTAAVSPAGDSVGAYQVSDVSARTHSDTIGSDVYDMVAAINAGTKTLRSIADQTPDLKEALSGKEMITQFFELSAVNGGIKTADGKYLLTLSVPALTDGMTSVQLLYYNTATGKWVLVDPANVDFVNKTITVELDDLSLAAVIANTDNVAAADTAVGTSPQTGISSSWMVWLGAAVVLAAAGAVTYRKARR